MKRNIKKLLMPVAGFAVFAMTACGDWIEPESLGIHTPSFEERNPELYAQYLEELRAYKAGDHKLVFATLNNTAAEAPSHRSQHLTAIPDSVDFIVLNNPDNLHPAWTKEMAEVRKKGTKVLYTFAFETYENAWSRMAEADPSLTELDALAYFTECVEYDLELCDKYGYDGLIFGYTGRPLIGIRGSEMPVYRNRQYAFLSAVSDWRAEHEQAFVAFMGRPENLVAEHVAILSDCDCQSVIVDTDNAANQNDLTVRALAAVETAGVPSDRIVVTALEIRPDDTDRIFGYYGTLDAQGNKLRAVAGAAEWVMQSSPAYTRAGLLIKDVEHDYFNRQRVYPHLREAISVMNSSKN